jgi:hypothetical protein
MSTRTRVTKPKPRAIRRVVYLLSTLTFIIVGVFVVRWILGPPGTTKEDQRQARIANSSPLRSGLPGYPKPSLIQLDDGKSYKDPDSYNYTSHSSTVTWQVTNDPATTFRSWATLLRADRWVIDDTLCSGPDWMLAGLKSAEPKMHVEVNFSPKEVTLNIFSLGTRSGESFAPIKRFDTSCPTSHKDRGIPDEAAKVSQVNSSQRPVTKVTTPTVRRR